MIEVSGFVDEARYFVCRSHWPPTVINSFARQSKVQTKVCIRMEFGVVSNLREPGAGHHQARGIDRPTLQSLDCCCIHCVGFTEVVSVNDNHLCTGSISESIRQSLSRNRQWKGGQKKAKQ